MKQLPARVIKPSANDGDFLQTSGGVTRWGAAPTGGATTLDDLTDVDTTTTPPTDGEALVYDATSERWVPGAVAAGGGGNVVLIEDGGSVPAGTPAGSIIIEKGYHPPILLLDNGASVPAGTRPDTIIVEKA